MPLSSLASVFSRYFVLGHFLPAFFAVFAFVLLNPSGWLHPHEAWQVAAVGGIALLLALFLDGLKSPIHSAFSGYRIPLVFGFAKSDAEVAPNPKQAPYLAVLSGLRRRQVEAQQNLRDDRTPLGRALLRSRFGDLPDNRIRPTRLGNRSQTFEPHLERAYGLTRSAWRRVEALLTSEQREALADRETPLRLFLNLSATSAVTGIALCVTWAVAAGQGQTEAGEIGAAIGSLVVGVLMSWLSYCWAVEHAEALSDLTAALFDVRVADLYAALGVQRPASTDERAFGAAITAFLDQGIVIPRKYRAPAGRTSDSA